MNKKAVLTWAIALLLLVACGGGSETESNTPTANNDTSSSTTTETTEENSTSADSAVVEANPTEASNETDAVMEEESVAAEAPVEEAPPSSPFGDRPMTGVDPETGLVVNPDSVNPGDTFLVRGKIISMNLTPTTSPEFLIESPDGIKFRIRSQSLTETFFEDGEQLQPFQYQKGLLVQATVNLAADASPSDIPISADLVLVKDE